MDGIQEVKKKERTYKWVNLQALIRKKKTKKKKKKKVFIILKNAVKNLFKCLSRLNNYNVPTGVIIESYKSDFSNLGSYLVIMKYNHTAEIRVELCTLVTKESRLPKYLSFLEHLKIDSRK